MKALIILSGVVFLTGCFDGDKAQDEQEQVTKKPTEENTRKKHTSNAAARNADRMEKASRFGVYFEGADKDQSWFEPSEEHLLMRTKLLNKEISIREYYLFREDARKMAMNYTWDENPLNIKLKDVIYLENISELVRNNFVNKKMHSEWLNYWNEDSIRIRNENIY